MGNARSTGRTSFFATMALLVPLFFLATPVSAQEGIGIDSAGVVGQLGAIRDELRAIVRLLGTVEEHQRVTALMTRIGLKQQRLSSIESELRSARSEQEGAEREIARLTGIEESWTKERERSEEAERGLEIMRQEKKSLASRVETLRMRIVELENDLGRAQEDILTLEETVDEQLGLR